MERIGHRGCAQQFPENTLFAVRETAKRLNWVEVDLRRCGTGEIVVFHDERVDRVTDGSGNVRDLSLETLRSLRVSETEHHIPTLRELVEELPAGLSVQLELKETGIAGDVVRLIDPIADRVRFSSFQPEALAEIAAAAPQADWGYLFGEHPLESLELAAELACSAVHPKATLCGETDVVETAHERSFDVIAWYGTSKELVELAENAGADGITTDHSDW